ncbi:MAG: gfo/Idh/MocA family oxidoreductase, partial [Anaerolineae bacterium]|nr:gfo/Idh/MocA family oxidoreductase [Anaerolineae bacterium]
ISYDYIGGMMSFGETFGSRIGRWIEQNVAGVSPDEIDASGADALHVQSIIEGIIESWETGQVVTLW